MTVDLAIVGAGPAGQAAAEAAAAAGLRVAVVDEQARPGGQILRQPPAGFKTTHWLPGRAYTHVKAQLRRFEALEGVEWIGRHSVTGAFRPGSGFELWLSGPAGGSRLTARRVLIAGGCYDMPVPVPGWTTPGVMAAGGVQAFIKSQLLVPGERFVLAGTHPLQLLVATQIVEAGGRVEAVLFAQPLACLLTEILRSPLIALRHVPPLFAGGSAFLRLGSAGVPVLFGAPLASIEGDSIVERLHWTGAKPGTVACDRVALCYGFIPQSDLVRALGARTRLVHSTGGWAAVHDEWMRSSVEGLYVAGETVGVGGAEVALREGRLAGLAIARDAAAIATGAAESEAMRLRRERDRLRDFAGLLDRLASPRSVLAQPLPDETIVCRCEDITAGQLRQALTGALVPGSANALKLETRAGMGLCQGRGCEHVVMEMMTRLSVRASNGPGYTARFPARPVPISDLID
jgi:thioredoxin reductase